MKFAFDKYLIDSQRLELICDGERLALEPKVFELLLYLVQNNDRVVSRDEIINSIWEGRFTSDSAVATLVKSLRRALGDTGGQQRIIKTLRGKGYRFIAECRAVEEALGETASPIIRPSTQLTELTAATQSAGLTGAGKPSIVVLPFQCASQDDSSLLIADGLAHELIQSLSRLRWLKVIARATAFRFRDANPDLPAIAQQLDVRYALCGTANRIGARQILSLELIRCENNEVIWAERFEQGVDAFAELQQTIVFQILSALELHIPQHEASQAAKHGSECLDAWQNYHLGLRHMFFFTSRDNQIAAEYFGKAVEQDAHFARAHAGLSFTRFQDVFLDYRRPGSSAVDGAINLARESAERGMALDPLDPFVNYNFGRCFWLEGKHDSGHTWLQKSVSLNPNFAQGHYALGFNSAIQGSTSSGEQNAGLALSLSPLDPLLYAIHGVTAMCKLQEGNAEEGMAVAITAANSPGAHYLISMIAAAACSLAGRPEQAGFWRQKTLASTPQASIDDFQRAFPFRSGAFAEQIAGALVQAGFEYKH